MFDDGFNIISKSGNSYRVLSRSGTYDLISQPDEPKPVQKVAPHPIPPAPPKKSEPEFDLVGALEDFVSSALDAALTESDPLADLRDDVANLNATLDATDQKVDALAQSEDELRDGTLEVLDQGATLLKYTGGSASGRIPMNVDDAAAASLARRRGR